MDVDVVYPFIDKSYYPAGRYTNAKTKPALGLGATNHIVPTRRTTHHVSDLDAVTE